MDIPRKTILMVLSVLIFSGCATTNIPTPSGRQNSSGIDAPAETILAYFSGIPYRPDGAIDQSGNFTLFADQHARPETPGLNCSGFTVAASRYFFARNYLLDEVMVDRLADSGPAAERGADWDFGYDVILNLTEGMQRKVMFPDGQTADISGSDGAKLRGFALHDDDAWADVLSRMTAEHVYLFSMSKPVNFNNYRLLHYHVGVILPDKEGHLWLSHATTRQGVTKVDLATSDGLKTVLEANPDTSLGKHMILIVEAPLK